VTWKEGKATEAFCGPYSIRDIVLHARPARSLQTWRCGVRSLRRDGGVPLRLMLAAAIGLICF